MLIKILNIFWYISLLKKNLGRILDKAHYSITYSIPTGFISGYNVNIHGSGTLIVKKGSYIGSGSSIQLAENNTVKIEENVRISHNVLIYTTSHKARLINGARPCYSNDITIERDVWIGANTILLPGSHIENSATIPANSIVKGKVSCGTIYKNTK